LLLFVVVTFYRYTVTLPLYTTRYTVTFTDGCWLLPGYGLFGCTVVVGYVLVLHVYVWLRLHARYGSRTRLRWLVTGFVYVYTRYHVTVATFVTVYVCTRCYVLHTVYVTFVDLVYGYGCCLRLRLRLHVTRLHTFGCSLRVTFTFYGWYGLRWLRYTFTRLVRLR